MISVSEEFKTAYLNGNKKDLTLTFTDGTVLTNDHIVSESMTLEQSISSDQQLTFGLCSAAQFKIKIFNSAKKYEGLKFTATITAHDEENNDYSMDLGIFTVAKDTVSDDRKFRNLTAYDDLYTVMNSNYADWYSNLTFPMTLVQFRTAFFEHIGIEQVPIALINDSMTVEKTVKTDNFSGAKILQAICEIDAVFGCINHEGKFQYIPFINEGGLYPADDLYPSDDIYPADGYDVVINGYPYTYQYGSFVYEDYISLPITGLAIVENADDTSVLYGTSENLYKITDNYLMYGKNAAALQTVAENFLYFVKGFMYNPAKIKMRAMPWLELGDIIGVVGKRGNAVFPVLKRTMTGITALYDQYQAKGREYYQFSANTTSGLEEKISSKTMKLEATIDEVASTLTERIAETQEDLESKISQTINNISLSVSSSKGGNAQISVSLDDGDGTSKTATANITSTDVINVIANKELNLTSNTININSTHFQVDSQGNVTATNGSFSGTITATGGSITGALTVTGSLTAGNVVISPSNVSINGCSLTGYGSDGIVCANYFAAERFVSKTDMSGSITNAECIVSAGNTCSAWWYDSNDAGYAYCKLNVSGYGWGNYKVYLYGSDERRKKNIKPTDKNALDIIKKIEHVQFDWKENNKHVGIGYIANDLDVIDDELADIMDEGSEQEHYMLNPNILHAIATKGIQELLERVERLEEKIG